MAVQRDDLELAVDILPILPLRGLLVFPYMVIPLDVGRPKSVAALEEAVMQERHIFLCAQKDSTIEEPDAKDVYTIGTVCEIKQLLKMPEGQIRVLVEGLYRARMLKVLQSGPFMKGRIQQVDEDMEESREMKALMRVALDRFEDYVKLSKRIPTEMLVALNGIEEPGRLADTIGAQLNLSVSKRQELLEELSVKERLSRVCVFLAEELEILRLERKIHLQVRQQMEKAQKEYYLREQIKVIQRELGEGDGRQSEMEQLRELIEEAEMPPEAHEKALHELGRLENMPPMAAEAVVVRTYLDWLINLPWNVFTEEQLDINKAQSILAEDHYGLEKVKERILEFLAVRQLGGQLKGPILCFVGPPGVGKTSLAKSIARAMGRNFVRFSLGGVRDEAEIRGHRRTYIGAMPGKIIQSVRKAGSANPLILLDEVDKMVMDVRGDPASALLEALDPEQNSQFGDHYLEVPYDLSHTFFITTANYLRGIPRPLQDRMEIIEIPGYTEEEKLAIARHHLWPKQVENHALAGHRVTVTSDAMRSIINEHTRESGVRELDRKLATICRKVAREILTTERKGTRITANNLTEYLGVPRYRQSILDQVDRIGVVTGLAYTEVGGDIMDVEVTVVAGKGNLALTGKLGEVMRESAQAALSFVRSRTSELGIRDDFYEHYDVHVHVPEGAVPKDGPSAGITITTALVSALTGRPVRGQVAMTGEVTLRGRILPVGGLKEKLLAARRSGVKMVLLPGENKKDVSEIPENILQDLDLRFVEHMDQVLDLVLLPSPPACWPQMERPPIEPRFVPRSVTQESPWVEDGHGS
jgi:ATP-dependent Lon protease